jgi:hypothetical protein
VLGALFGALCREDVQEAIDVLNLRRGQDHGSDSFMRGESSSPMWIAGRSAGVSRSLRSLLTNYIG